MKIPIRHLTPEGRDLDERIALEDLGLEGEAWNPVADAVVRVRVSRVQDEIHTKGEIRVGLRVECSRCLEPYVQPIEGTFEVFHKQIEAAPGSPVELPESTDAAFEYFTGHHVDLTGTLRDAVVLSFPSRLLCREDCQGLCPHCGENRNEGPCVCPDQIEAPVSNPFQQFFQSRGRRP